MIREGVAIMHLEGVDVSITGNSTNPTRFQHPVAGTYKKECLEEGKDTFLLHLVVVQVEHFIQIIWQQGQSCGMTDTLGRMHPVAQFDSCQFLPMLK